MYDEMSNDEIYRKATRNIAIFIAVKLALFWAIRRMAKSMYKNPA